MTKIQRLSPALASQIAAGEVVERPASALKELIENSLDAEASRCDVEIEGGGVTRLTVRDDGFGMSAEDALMSIERHATSKLRRFEDLTDMPSYGFRGEALPSIASVSRFTLRTRARGEDTGSSVVVHGGTTVEVAEIGMPIGTQIDICDLFFNVPARRKFLKSSGTEAGHISEVVESAALSTPSVTFTLQRDGRKVREWLRASDRAARVAAQYADEELAHCAGERGPLRVEAYLGRPERARAGSAGLKLFCNRRPIRDRSVLHTLAQAYGSVLERGRYPRGVVYLDLPPQLVDVNVHPQKSEVRFADGRAVTDAIYDIVSSQLARAFALPNATTNRWSSTGSNESWVHRSRSGASLSRGYRPLHVAEPAPARANTDAVHPLPVSDAADGAPGDAERVSQVHSELLESDERYSAAGASDTVPASSSDELLQSAEQTAAGPVVQGIDPGDPTADSVAEDSAQTGAEARQQRLIGISAPPAAPAVKSFASDADVRWGRLRFAAQVRSTYMICEGEEGLFVVDQHAAAERVNFHRLKTQFAERNMPSQALLFPVTLDVPAEHAELAQRHERDIARLGFEVRAHGETTISVHRVPKLLQTGSTERLMRDLLMELARSGRGFSDAIDTALSTIACHGSVRAGDVLSVAQAQALLRALDDTDFSGHCPHGRPIVAFTPWSELERKVGRR